MPDPTLIGREDLVEQVAAEIRKGKHVLLTGPIGIGKSAVLEAALGRIERRRPEREEIDLDEAAEKPPEPRADPPEAKHRKGRQFVLLYLADHQAKGQFVEMARELLHFGLIRPSALDLPKYMDREDPEAIEWAKIRRSVNRLSIRDLTGAIIPALHAHREHSGARVIVAVDDMTRLTPTQQAFWLAVFDCAQVVTCCSEKRPGTKKLWWKMRELAVPALTPEASAEIVRAYIAEKGVLIESPELYVSHVVKQAGGNPQAIADMLDDSAKERLIDKRQIREMRHQAGVRYLDFTPVMIVSGALLIGARYLAIGLGDTALYVLAGLGAAVFLSFRFLMIRGMGKAN